MHSISPVYELDVVDYINSSTAEPIQNEKNLYIPN